MAFNCFETDTVPFQLLMEPHQQLAREQCRGTVRVISHPTEFDFEEACIERLMPTSSGSGMKVFFHSALFVPRDVATVSDLSCKNSYIRAISIPDQTSAVERIASREFSHQMAQLGHLNFEISDSVSSLVTSVQKPV